MTGEEPRESKGLLRYGIFVFVAVASIFGMWFGMDLFEQQLKPQEFAANLKVGTLLPDPKPLVSVRLTDQDGKPLTAESFRGHWTFLAIGYTACPDVCPTLMATFRFMDQILASKGVKPAPKFLFVSVDPERDTPENVGKYVHYFNPNFMGATGEQAALRTLTGQLGLMYRKAEDQTSAMGYMIDHSAAIVLIDPDAAWKAIFSPPHDPEIVAADFVTIKAQYLASTAESQP
jgi:protein SCO1/2